MSTLFHDDVDGLEAFARSNGCTLAQVKNAVETIGEDGEEVRKYLIRRGQIASKKAGARGVSGAIVSGAIQA
jgi:hypothetical protein